MENVPSKDYRSFQHLHFAVWNMVKPINYIWIDFEDGCVRCGTKDEPTDAVKDEIEAIEQRKNAFIELISYDDEGKPLLGFDSADDPYVMDSRCTEYPVSEDDLAAFLCDMHDMELLSWRNHFPSMREGLCWRIDIYYEGGEKHLSGQSRFPEHWVEFGKTLGNLVKKAQSGTDAKQTAAE